MTEKPARWESTLRRWNGWPARSDFRTGMRGATLGSAMALLLVTAITVSPAVAQTPAQAGQWAGPFAWPLVAIHIVLLPNGQVLTFDGPPEDGGQSARL